MNDHDMNDEKHRMRSTNGYQSTKLNKNREMRQKAQLKTDLAQMERQRDTDIQKRRKSNSGMPERKQPQRASEYRPERKQPQRTSERRSEAGRRPQISQPERRNGRTDIYRQDAERQRRARERNRRRRRQVLCIQIGLLFFSALILVCLAGLIKKVVSNEKEMEAEATIEEEIKSVLSNVTDDAVNITKYYVYGTHLNLEGRLSVSEEIQTIELVLVDDKKGIVEDTESVAEDEMEKIYVLSKTINEDGSYSFKTAENINEGINLENISDGDYCMLLKIIYSTGNKEYKSLTDSSGENAITYYTLTKNGKNQKIDISFENDANSTKLNYLQVRVAESSLPEDVYDIVVDAGHGGKDTGAVYGSYTEAELTLQYAKAIQESLEEQGLKVKLTRDGSESSEEDMAYTMYNENGRVSISCRSNAKYCLSIHLNSNAETLAKGGVQIYCSIRGNSEFAQLVADGIVEDAGTYYSNMETGRTVNGVYQSPYSEQGISLNVATAEKYGFEPYNYNGVDALFMIRELGGIATGAFVDGRDTRYGSNEYRNSNTGVETLLIELGYININEDLENILSNQKGYVKGITDAVMQQITALRTS